MDVTAQHAVAPLVESIHATHLGCARAISTVWFYILGSDTVIPHHRLEEFLTSLSSYWAKVHCVDYPHVVFGFCSWFFKKVLSRNDFCFLCIPSIGAGGGVGGGGSTITAIFGVLALICSLAPWRFSHCTEINIWPERIVTFISLDRVLGPSEHHGT